MQRTWSRPLIALSVAAALVAAACTADDGDADPPATETAATASEGVATSQPSTGDAPTSDTAAPPTDTAAPTTEPAPTLTEDRAFYILPPGNYGGLPTTDQSTDQLALYDGLTPLRGDVTDADIDELFLDMDFEPIGETTEEDTGRSGTTIVYDEFGIPHITGETREDLAFGAGWVTARDRALLVDFGRGPSRAAVADIPGIDAFSLVTSGQPFTPSEATEQLVSDQVQLIIDTYGEEGEEIIADAQAYADGMTAYWEANGIEQEPATVNDVIAVTAFIGSIFGSGGGAEARNATFLSELQAELGDERGRQVWEDLLPDSDPEAPTTIEERFDYPALTGGEVTGSVIVDAGSFVPVDPTGSGGEPGPVSEPAENPAPTGEAIPDEEIEENDGSTPDQEAGVVYATDGGPPTRNASNWLTIEPGASTNGTTLAVMGPQLGYYYPGIVQQMHLSGPGIEAQGVAVPGLAMYLLIGRTADYAWSLTSANLDVRDVFAEFLCEPDGSEPTLQSRSYEHDGECVAFEEFDAGLLGDVPIRYPTTVHGPVIGVATSEGSPIALSSQRSTFGRDGLNLKALKNMTEGDAGTAEQFFDTANGFEFTFNWGYSNRDEIAYFASGRLPVRAEGLDRRLPTLGTGDYEWQGFLERDDHPHATGHPSGRLLSWNNQSAPGFMHGDNDLYGSVHRVEGFDQWPDQVDLAGVVGVMNRAATEDTRSTVWPVISDVLAGGDAPSALASEVVDILDAWTADDAPLLDADDDGTYDTAGGFIFDEVFESIAAAVAEPVLGSELFENREGIGDASLVDKDLRTVLGEDVEGPFATSFCGAGDLDDCRSSLWEAIDGTVQALAAERGDDPAEWLVEADRTSFIPELIEDTFRSTNRPVYQQVIEFAPGG